MQHTHTHVMIQRHGIVILVAAGFVMSIPSLVFATEDDSMSEKIEFGAALEESLGHFKALEDNLNDGNTQLAMTHATHPIAELYHIIKPTLDAADPDLNTRLGVILDDLADKASTSVSRNQAQSAIEQAKGVIEEARTAVIGNELSSDHTFKLMLMRTLLETSIAEYGEAVADGAIHEMAEFQDGSAFVWRAEQILNTVKDDLDGGDYEELVEIFDEINAAYDQRADPSVVDERTRYLLAEIDQILGIEDGRETTLLDYVENINILLEDARAEYNAGNSDLAQSHVTKAYLNNYEFLEGPLVEAGERELMEEIEVMMREDLRGMIQQGSPASEVSSQIDAILVKMETVAVIVPEFGAMATVVLAIAAMTIIAISARSRLFAKAAAPLSST